MNKFMNFIYFNILVYIFYAIIDKILLFLNLYSNNQLGEDISIIPTSLDVVLIIINVLISSLLSLYLIKIIKDSRGY